MIVDFAVSPAKKATLGAAEEVEAGARVAGLSGGDRPQQDSLPLAPSQTPGMEWLKAGVLHSRRTV